MSKPDKYKTPAEKGITVPGTSVNDSGYKPYTIPYTGAGAHRNTKGDWVPQRSMFMSAVPSHAAPPLYVRKREEKKPDKDGKQSTSAQDPKGTQQHKEDAKEPQRFHPTVPGIHSKPKNDQ
ncbi:hypothetical protein F4781DRAFT_430347 [Annulohypoxylon bovei var. microspora]|nr:hypothetical protein F4781DRAFT_430347 [Annulohypoxylon bovei var. microspora]